MREVILLQALSTRLRLKNLDAFTDRFDIRARAYGFEKVIGPGGFHFKAQIVKPIPGLYDSIAVRPVDYPTDWDFGSRRPTELHNLNKHLAERVTYGRTRAGIFAREYDEIQKTLIMDVAYLEITGSQWHRLPSWVENEFPLVRGRGTPTQAYATMNQMKRLGIQHGSLKGVKMSNIQDYDTILQLAAMKKMHPEKSLNELIEYTHSVQYAKTPLIQSGHKTVPGSFKVKTEHGQTLTVAELQSHLGIDPTDPRMIEYGLRPDDEVLAGFDIVWELEPF